MGGAEAHACRPDAHQARGSGAEHLNLRAANKAHVGQAFCRDLHGRNPGDRPDLTRPEDGKGVGRSVQLTSDHGDPPKQLRLSICLAPYHDIGMMARTLLWSHSNVSDSALQIVAYCVPQAEAGDNRTAPAYPPEEGQYTVS